MWYFVLLVMYRYKGLPRFFPRVLFFWLTALKNFIILSQPLASNGYFFPFYIIINFGKFLWYVAHLSYFKKKTIIMHLTQTRLNNNSLNISWNHKANKWTKLKLSKREEEDSTKNPIITHWLINIDTKRWKQIRLVYIVVSDKTYGK